MAPLAGIVVSLDEVPDPVFSEAVIGPGLAILPDEQDELGGTQPVRVVVVSPCAGRLLSVYPHAVVVAVDTERAVLVHLGVDTEDLASACFDVVVTEGDTVEAGQPLLAWSPGCVRAEGRSTLCPIVALQAEVADVTLVVAPGERVAEGQVLLAWT